MYHYPRLRDLREDADKTQKQIGALLNTTQQQYAKYESGIQEIPVHHLVALADYYHTSTDYLLGRTDSMKIYPKKREK
jgi:transcriptional regulator with XRE-family HTH domain